MAEKTQEPLVILKRKNVESRVGLSRSSIYAAIKAGTFPAPVSLGEKSVGWLQHEIEAWISSRAAARPRTSATQTQTAQQVAA